MATFNMNQRFRISYEEQLDMAGVAALTTVYLPIIGRNAYALYLAFAFETADNATISHVDLLDRLTLNTQQFVEAREQLEGMGLLQTFEQDTNTSTQWLYRMFAPLSIKNFLAEKLLASLLAHYLGEDSFEKLVAQYQPDETDMPGINVSKSLFDIIAPDAFETLNDAPVVTDEEQPINRDLSQVKNDLDLGLMSQMLIGTAIKTSDLRLHAQELVLQKHLYGLNDVELVRAIQQSVSISGQLDIAKLSQQLASGFQRQQNSAVQLPKSAASNVADSDTQHPLISLAQSQPPLQFLARMRSQSNGIVTDNEQRMLTEIIKMQLLPDDAINIALYELTAVEHRTSLNKGLMQTIVNDWAQAGVRSARDALKYLKKRQQGATQQNISGRSQKTWRRPVAKETRPDWENQSAEKASDELMREAQATLEKLKKED